MEVLRNLGMGFAALLSVQNILFAIAGILLGEIVGILPGLGPVVTIAVLLPFTYSLEPLPALVMFCGIYYGSQFGGAISSILVNAPGTESAVMTAVEGYPMAKRGEAGKALAAAAISSFIGGIIGSLLVAYLANIVVALIISFGAPEYLALMVFALCCIVGMSENTTIWKSMIAICTGLAIGTIGQDKAQGIIRMAYGEMNLYEGVDFAVMAIGMFAVAEVFRNLSAARRDGIESMKPMEITGKVGLTKKELLYILPTQIRNTLFGFFIGVLPGVGTATSTPLSYALEKRINKNKGRWGDGELRGLAAAESSNNACAMGALMPLLTMGVPGSSAAAIMLSAFMILGITPGPLLFTQQPNLLWGIIASFFIGNILLVVINLPLVKYFVKIVKIPAEILYVAVGILSLVGAFSVANRVFDIGVVIVLALISIAFGICKIPLAPMLVAVLLGEMMETNLARSMVICHQNWNEFFSRPIVLVFITLSVFIIIVPKLLSLIEKRKAQATKETTAAEE